MLELYPKGAVVSRIAAPGEHFIDYYSYFSMTPYWSENKYPLRTGISSCSLIVLIVLKLLMRNRSNMWDIMVLIIGILTIVFSGLAANYQYESTIAYIISILLVFSFLTAAIGMLLKKDKAYYKNEGEKRK